MSGIRHACTRAMNTCEIDPGAAIAQLEEIIRKYPGDPMIPEVKYRLGCLYLQRGDRSRAREMFQSLQETAAGTPWETAARIELLGLDAGTSPESTREKLARLRKTVTDADVAGRADFYIGETYFAQERWSEALAAYRKGISFRVTPGANYMYWLRVGTCELRLGRFAEAERDLKRAEQLPTADARVYEQLARLGIETRDRLLALQMLDKGLRRGSHSSLFTFARDYLRGLPENQLEWVRKQLTHGPFAYLVEMERIERLVARGELDRVEYMLSELLFRYPEHAVDIQETGESIRRFTSVRRDHLGLMAPLSGKLAGIGQSMYRGAHLAVTRFRETHPEQPVQLLARDTEGDADRAQEVFRELSETERVIGIVGPAKSSSAQAIAESATTDHLPVISPGCPMDGVVNASEYLFRMYPSVERECYILVRYLIRQHGYHTFATVFPEIDYGISAQKGVLKALREFGGELVFSASYPEGIMNYSAVLAGLKESEPDVIVVPDNAERAGQVAGQIRYQEVIDPIIVGAGAWEDPIILQVAGNHLEGSFFITEYPMFSGERLNVREDFHRTFGEWPDAFAFRSYEATMLILESLAKGVKYREQLAFFLANPQGVSGIDGLAAFDSAGNYTPPMTVYRIGGGEMVPWVRWEDSGFRSLVPTPTPEPMPTHPSPY